MEVCRGKSGCLPFDQNARTRPARPSHVKRRPIRKVSARLTLHFLSFLCAVPRILRQDVILFDLNFAPCNHPVGRVALYQSPTGRSVFPFWSLLDFGDIRSSWRRLTSPLIWHNSSILGKPPCRKGHRRRIHRLRLHQPSEPAVRLTATTTPTGK